MLDDKAYIIVIHDEGIKLYQSYSNLDCFQLYLILTHIV